MLISHAKEQTIIHHEMKKIKLILKSAQFETEHHQNSQHLAHHKQDADEENIL